MHLYLWLIACDANLEPDGSLQGKWFSERGMIISVPAADLSTSKSQRVGGVGLGRVYDYVVTFRGLHSKTRKVEDFEGDDSRRHKPVRFVRCRKEPQEFESRQSSAGAISGKVPKVTLPQRSSTR